jgi:hypothetical protein
MKDITVITATAANEKEALERHTETITEELEGAEWGDQYQIVCHEAEGFDTDGAGIDVIALGNERFVIKSYTATMDSDPAETDIDGILRMYAALFVEIENWQESLEID